MSHLKISFRSIIIGSISFSSILFAFLYYLKSVIKLTYSIFAKYIMTETMEGTNRKIRKPTMPLFELLSVFVFLRQAYLRIIHNISIFFCILTSKDQAINHLISCVFCKGNHQKISRSYSFFSH